MPELGVARVGNLLFCSLLFPKKILLFKERPCANHSLKKSNCELIALVALYKRAKYQIVPFSWIVHASLLLICKEWQEQFALVALYKRATVSSLLSLYFKKEWKIKSFIFFWANCDFALSLTKRAIRSKNQRVNCKAWGLQPIF